MHTSCNPQLSKPSSFYTLISRVQVVGAFTGDDSADAAASKAAEAASAGSDKTFDNRVLSKVVPKLHISFFDIAEVSNVVLCQYNSSEPSSPSL